MRIYCSTTVPAIHYPAYGDNKNSDIKTQFIHTLTVVNTGKSALKNIEVGHRFDISHDDKIQKGNANKIIVSVVPDCEYSYKDDGKTLVFASLEAKAMLIIYYLYPANINLNNTTIHKINKHGHPQVRSEKHQAKPINYFKAFNIPIWLQFAFWIFLVIGFWLSASAVGDFLSLANIYLLFLP